MSDPAIPVSIDTLLSHVGWVRGLAHSLVKDENAAEDLAQETMLAALEHPPTSDHNLRGWFRRVMMNAQIGLYRSDARRTAREVSAAASDVQPDTTEIVARAEMQRRLVGHVLALPEPNRDVILMRHFDDMEQREIAARLGVPVHTINYRLQRGYELLRERLGIEEGPNWTLALVPLLRWPGRVPFHVPAPVDRASIRGTALVAGAVAAVVAGAFWLSNANAVPPPGDVDAVTERTGSATPDTRNHRTAARTLGAAGDASTDDANQTDPAAAPGPSPVDPAARNRAVARGTVEADAGAVPADLVVRFTPLFAARMTPAGPPRDITVKAGALETELPYVGENGLRIAEWELFVDHPDFLRFTSRLRMPLRAEGKVSVDVSQIRLQRAAFVTGSVRWDPAHPSDVASVATATFVMNGSGTAFDEVEVTSGGAFRLRVVPEKRSIVAAGAPDRAPAAADVLLGAGETRDVGVLELAPGSRIAGRVSSPRAPVAANESLTIVSARKRLFEMTVGAHYVGWDEHGVWRYYALPQVDAEGRYSVDGMPAGEFTVDVSRVVGRATRDLIAAAPRTFTAPTDGADIEIRGGLMRVSILAYGLPMPNSKIAAAPPRGQSAECAAGDNGSAALLGAPGTTYVVSASAPGFQTARTSIVAPAADTEVHATIELVRDVAVGAPATAVWTVTVRNAGGDPPGVASFGFFPATGGGRTSSVKHFRDVRGAGGVFRIEDVPAGRWRVEIRPGCEWYDPAGFLVAPDVELEFAPGADTRHDVTAEPAGRLVATLREADGSIAGGFKCRILDATSRPVPCTFVKRGTASTSLGSSPSSDGPSDVCPALAPGMYQFEYSTTVQKQNVRATQPFEIVAGKVTDLTIHVAPR